MNQETKSVLQISIISVLFTSLIVGLISGGLYLYNGKILFNILFSLAGVLSIGYLYNLYIIQKFNKFIVEKQVEIEKEAQKLIFSIECCDCGKVHDIRIDFTQDMTFECEQCNTNNKVFYLLKTGRTTDIPENTNVLKLIDELAGNDNGKQTIS